MFFSVFDAYCYKIIVSAGGIVSFYKYSYSSQYIGLTDYHVHCSVKVYYNFI